MPRRTLMLVPVLAFVALAAVIAYFMLSGRDPKIIPSALIDKPVPEFALPGLDGVAEGFATADLKGQVTVVNVFASWCIPCRAEHPQVTALGRLEGITLYGLNYKDAAADATKWLAELGNPYARIGADGDGRVGIDLGVYGVPETFLIDRDGVIRFKFVGPMTPANLEDTIVPILKDLQK